MTTHPPHLEGRRADETAPPRDSTTSFLVPRSLWARAGAVLLALLTVGVVFVAGMFLTVASPRGGWFYAALCFLPGLVTAARVGGVRRWRDTLLVAASVSFLLGLGMYQISPPDHGRIASVAQDAGIPGGWEHLLTDEQGNTWCFKGCPQITYSYAAAESPDEAVARLDEMLARDGWVGGPQPRNLGGGEVSEYDPLARGSWSRGRWRVAASVPSTRFRYPWQEDAAARGLTPVEVTFAASN